MVSSQKAFSVCFWAELIFVATSGRVMFLEKKEILNSSQLRTFCVISFTNCVNLGTYCENLRTYCVRFFTNVKINSKKEIST